jgi:hypothetical protein
MRNLVTAPIKCLHDQTRKKGSPLSHIILLESKMQGRKKFGNCGKTLHFAQTVFYYLQQYLYFFSPTTCCEVDYKGYDEQGSVSPKWARTKVR